MDEIGKKSSIFDAELYKKANIGHNNLMNRRNQDLQDQILAIALEDVPFDGWRWDIIETAAEKAGLDKDIALAIFPAGLSDVLRHFSDWADRQMLISLADINPNEMRVRDRIQRGVQTRLEILEPNKEAVRAASVYWLVPFRKIEAGKVVWQTADIIWKWAGDDATDYNHYTKRGLLSGVITTTTMAWLNDTSENHAETSAFLDRRIDNVLKVGGFAGKFLGRFMGRIKSKEKHV